MANYLYNPGIALSNGRYTTGSEGENVRQARKEYVCDHEECGKAISKGDFYIAVTNPRGMYGNLTKHYHFNCPEEA